MQKINRFNFPIINACLRETEYIEDIIRAKVFAGQKEIISKDFAEGHKIRDDQKRITPGEKSNTAGWAQMKKELCSQCEDWSKSYEEELGRQGRKTSKMEDIIFDTLEEIKTFEQQLILANKKAEESDLLKSEFLRNLSHEVRTPINGIIGFAELLNNEDLTMESRSKYTKIIQSRCYQLMNTLDDILEISCLETCQQEPLFVPVNLNELLMEAYLLFSKKAKKKGLILAVEKGLPYHASQVLTDGDKLMKALNNLLDNAVKYTSMGSVKYGYFLKENTIQFYVKDTGIGISPENIKNIFIKFSQESKDISRDFGGLGLGLSISQKIVELLGGNIKVESIKGLGSTFYLNIPYKPVKDES